jgi:hypothetical protein
MASYLYGIDSGLVVDISMGVVTASGDLSDIAETVRPSNLIIGMTEAQFNLLFDVSSVSGTLVLDASALQNVFVDILNFENQGTTWTYLDNAIHFAETTFDDICSHGLSGSVVDTSLYVYNLVDYIQQCRYYLNPDADLDEIKKQFIVNSLNTTTSDPSFGDLSDVLLTTYTNLGFFESLAGALGGAEDVLGKDEAGNGSNPAVSGDVIIDTTGFNGSGLFAAIADAGFITADGISDTDLSLEDGFAISVQLKLSGTTNITVNYPSDISFVDPSSGAVTGILSDLSGVLIDGEVVSTALKLSDPEITKFLATGTLLNTDDGAASQTINVLLFKYDGDDGL